MRPVGDPHQRDLRGAQRLAHRLEVEHGVGGRVERRRGPICDAQPATVAGRNASRSRRACTCGQRRTPDLPVPRWSSVTRRYWRRAGARLVADEVAKSTPGCPGPPVRANRIFPVRRERVCEPRNAGGIVPGYDARGESSGIVERPAAERQWDRGSARGAAAARAPAAGCERQERRERDGQEQSGNNARATARWQVHGRSTVARTARACGGSGGSLDRSSMRQGPVVP